MKQFCDLTLKNWRIRIPLAFALALALIAAGALAQGDPIFDCAQLDEFILAGASLYSEEREWYEQNCVEEEEEFIIWPPLPTPTPRPLIDTCGQLPADIVVSGHLQFATQCQRLGAGGVGNDALVAQGILDALDVWANVDAEVRVCFRRHGSLKFLDAATAPRQVSDLAAEYIDGLTCGRINRGGTVVLLPGGAPEAQPIEAPAEAPPDIVVPPGKAPYICQLMSGDILNLRANAMADAEILAEIPFRTLLVPLNRRPDWFQVAFAGLMGWVSKDYVFQSVGCNAFNAAGNAPPPTTAESSASADQAQSPDPAGSLQDCTLRTLDILNLRTGAGLEHDILAELPYQFSLNALAREGIWFQVTYAGQTGWVHSDYVSSNDACG